MRRRRGKDWKAEAIIETIYDYAQCADLPEHWDSATVEICDNPKEFRELKRKINAIIRGRR